MTKEMLINTVENQECRIAIVEDGVLEELYFERASSALHVGNIYNGRITNVESAIQAAFVDFGLSKNGFLHISDVHPKYFPKGHKAPEAVGRKRPHHQRPPIQECLHRGQEVVVQMTKEGIGTKGPTMTTYLSIPGRLLVMMPGMSRLGVSRRIEDDDVRAKARNILNDLKLPSDMGFIVRTAGLDRNKRDLQRDLTYLMRLWESVKHRITTARAPSEIYQESDLVIRTLRDVYNTDIDRVICDSEVEARKAQEFLDLVMPRAKHTVELYVGKEGLFHDYGLESEIEKIYSRRVELPSGGSLVIDQAEALVAIDVNSGRFREHTDAETTALKINLQAAREITRQLRLRDLGGVIVMDFIDMREEKNRRTLERALREAIKRDRAKTKTTRISPFGIIEMTRQRIRPSLQRSIYRTCPHCDGAGLIKSEESLALMIMRNLQRATSNDEVAKVEVSVTPSVAHHLANCERRRITALEEQTGKTILIRAEAGLAGQEVNFVCTNSRGAPIAWQQEQTKTGTKRSIQTSPVERRQAPQGPLDEDQGFEETTALEEEAPEFAAGPAQPPAAHAAPPAGKEHAAPSAQTAPAETRPGGAGVSAAHPHRTPASGKPPGPAAAPVEGQPQAKKRRRGRRGGRRHKTQAQAPVTPAGPQPGAVAQESARGAEAAQQESGGVVEAIKAFVAHEARRVTELAKAFTSRQEAAQTAEATGKAPAREARAAASTVGGQAAKTIQPPAVASPHPAAAPARLCAIPPPTPPAQKEGGPRRRTRRGGRKHKKHPAQAAPGQTMPAQTPPAETASAAKGDQRPAAAQSEKEPPAAAASPGAAPGPKPQALKPPRGRRHKKTKRAGINLPEGEGELIHPDVIPDEFPWDE